MAINSNATNVNASATSSSSDNQLALEAAFADRLWEFAFQDVPIKSA